MRPIDADALRKYFEVPHELKCGIQAGMDVYALKCIDEQPTVEPASPWHRVEDGLPEEEGRYFIAVFYKGKWLYNVAWFVKDIGNILGVPGSDGKGGFVSNSAEVYPDCWMMPIEPPKEDA